MQSGTTRRPAATNCLGCKTCAGLCLAVVELFSLPETVLGVSR